MVSSSESPSFQVGSVYNRQADIHGRYGGQQQGGISTPAEYPLIFLFTGESGSQYGYVDRFREDDGTFWYTGEGQEGDMEMTRGNRAIRDHEANDKELHLFEAVGQGQVRYVGQATYLSHHWEERKDANEDMRDTIVFELAVETETDEHGSAGASEPSPEYDADRNLRSLTLEELRNLALDRAPPSASEEERRENVQRRSEAVKEYVLRRANGICEGCGEEAPFTTNGGRPYLEAHHIRRLSDGGPDHPRWVVALCPNCHRRVHYGRDGDEYNSQLADQLGEIEDA